MHKGHVHYECLHGGLEVLQVTARARQLSIQQSHLVAVPPVDDVVKTSIAAVIMFHGIKPISKCPFFGLITNSSIKLFRKRKEKEP